MSASVISVVGLVKDYGRTRALEGLDLEVRQGEVFGFIGPNGAGKSTTIRVIMDLLRPTAGDVTVFGVEPRLGGAELRRRIGYLPGEPALTGRVSAGEQLRHLAALRGGRGLDQISALAGRFRLDLGRPMRTLSKGNRQKVAVIQAFMHEPELLVLDEPTSGLDPLLQFEFLELLRETAERGATVLMSSHVLREVESVADRVAVIRAGKTMDVDSVDGLRERAGQRVTLRFERAPSPDEFEAIPGVAQLRIDGAELQCLLHGEPDALLKVAAQHRVTAWSARDRDLEDLFLDAYRLGEANANTVEVDNAN